jgi:uncharacterized protein (DUF302 family)
MTTDSPIHSHSMTRIDVHTGVPFADFLAAFEAAAPPYDPVPMQRIVESGGSWDDVRAKVAENAPNELMVYAKIDAIPLLGVAGHDVKAVEYLLGNHVIAETMFRHDPRTLLYAPLRVLVYSDPDGNAVFSMDQPSSAFGSLGIAEVSEVGLSLDRKVVNMLRVIGVDPGEAFGA